MNSHLEDSENTKEKKIVRFLVRLYECDVNLRLRAASFVRFMQVGRLMALGYHTNEIKDHKITSLSSRFFSLQSIRTDKTQFALRSESVVRHDLYHSGYLMSNTPIKGYTTIHKVGRTSLTLGCELLDQFGNTLATGYNTLVMIDRGEGGVRATPFPESFRSQALHVLNPVPQYKTAVTMRMPEEEPESFEGNFVVQASNLDINKHVNHAVYTEWCEDTLLRVYQKRPFSNDMINESAGNSMKSMTVEFLKETLWNDVVRVVIWCVSITKDEATFAFDIWARSDASEPTDSIRSRATFITHVGKSLYPRL